MLPLLRDDVSGSQLANPATRTHQVFLATEQIRFLVVEHQRIDLAQQGDQFRSVLIDPEIHRVHHGKGRSTHLAEHARLGHWSAVSQEQEVGVSIRRRNIRFELFKYVEVATERFSLIQIVEVFAGPAKSLAAGDHFESLGTHSPIAQQLMPLLGKVLSDHTDQLDLPEQSRRQREMYRRSSEGIFDEAIGSLDRIEGDASYHHK